MGYEEIKKGKYTFRIYPNGDKKCYVNGELHCENGTAVEYSDGSKIWCINGELHREDGPAVEWINGYKEWYLNGKRYTKETFYSIMWNKLTRKVKLDYIYGL